MLTTEYLLFACLSSCLKASSQENNVEVDGFCSKEDSCKSKDSKLSTINPIKVGNVQRKKIGENTIEIKTLALKPKLFEIDSFLTKQEAEHLIHLANESGLEKSSTINDKSGYDRMNGLKLMDINNDKLMSIDEMRVTFEDAFDFYLNQKDILNMYKELNMDPNNDRGLIAQNWFPDMITPSELENVKVDDVVKYVKEFVKKYPVKHSRQSYQTWLHPDETTDPVYERIQRKVQQLTGLSWELIQASDFQVVRYRVDGHYNAHYDSNMLNDNLHCCHRNSTVSAPCTICRFMTVLFYLNDVEEGGETAFPIADNSTFDIMEFRSKHLIDLQEHCRQANLVVEPKQGKAVFWYNHEVNSETDWLGELDEFSFHGGCPVVKGEKWIANFWIKAVEHLNPRT